MAIRAVAVGMLLALVAAAAAAAAPIPAPVTVYPSRDAAPQTWRQGFDGAGVGIAVVDSGVTPEPDFGSRLVQVRLPGQTGSLDDVLGHGTLVAGIAAAAARTAGTSASRPARRSTRSTSTARTESSRAT